MAATKKHTEAKEAGELKPGLTVRIHEKIKEKGSKGEDKERIQVFEGMIIARKHHKEIGSTITVRKVSDGVGVEKIYPINSPIIAKIEAVKQAQVRRAKLAYLRHSAKRLREVKI